MDDLALLVDLHADGARQGPGGAEETRLSVALSGLAGRAGLRIADVGCGTGAATLVLADALDARITAVDLHPVFLETLAAAARAAGLSDRITTRAASMEALPFAPGELDAIWSEGAIYNMGFEAGAAAWRGFLKPGGILAVSELTWLTDRRPSELEAHWHAQYPEVDTASAKMAVLERLGFSPVGYFSLPERCWLENYYEPLRRRFPGFLARHGGAPAARAIVAAEEDEIALYERYRGYFGYGYYIARKVGD
ncbi:class I SAM-dependent methyltransferase [Salinarimonas rosea]|uniref:class I SAM-dependent methyltransferase n=1 Tax=Salinarimonas rosea TaxID=552063 RepID=UPI00040E388F|nr:class I SAM-dependent methyltransferase [Salinarimonas rosea]